MLDWHRRLIALRRERPELRDGRLDQVTVEFHETSRWLSWRRGQIELLVNLGEREHTFEFDEEPRILLASPESVAVGGWVVPMPPDSVAVVYRVPG